MAFKKIELGEQDNVFIQFAVIEIMRKNNESKDEHRKKGDLESMQRCHDFDKQGHEILKKLQDY